MQGFDLHVGTVIVPPPLEHALGTPRATCDGVNYSDRATVKRSATARRLPRREDDVAAMQMRPPH